MKQWKAFINGGHKHPCPKMRIHMTIFVMLIFGLTLVPAINNMFVHKDAAPLWGVDNDKSCRNFHLLILRKAAFKRILKTLFPMASADIAFVCEL